MEALSEHNKGLNSETMQASCDLSNITKTKQNGRRSVELLDLSDDVLLYILKHCTPRDLKALGFTCERLGNLVCDHTLWQEVDARAYPTGPARAKWFLTHVLHTGTKELLLSGFARAANGWLKSNDAGVIEKKHINDASNITTVDSTVVKEKNEDINKKKEKSTPSSACRQYARLHFAPRQLPRYSVTRTPFTVEILHESKNIFDTADDTQGPQLTLTHSLYKELRARCPHLTSLSLEYCNINYCAAFLSQLPPTLKKLSLRGTEIYNLPGDKSVLFNIKCYLPELEYLDLSSCSWLEPRCMLTLSKITNLKQLLMQDCLKMREFVAYASLATRYGFCNLEVLDLRRTPVGDSEVSALGWLPKLQELYLSPCSDSALNSEEEVEDAEVVPELDAWELEEPEYYKLKSSDEQLDSSDDNIPVKSNTWIPSGATLINSDRPVHFTLRNNMVYFGNDTKRKLTTNGDYSSDQYEDSPSKKRIKRNSGECNDGERNSDLKKPPNNSIDDNEDCKIESGNKNTENGNTNEEPRTSNGDVYNFSEGEDLTNHTRSSIEPSTSEAESKSNDSENSTSIETNNSSNNDVKSRKGEVANKSQHNKNNSKSVITEQRHDMQGCGSEHKNNAEVDSKVISESRPGNFSNHDNGASTSSSSSNEQDQNAVNLNRLCPENVFYVNLGSTGTYSFSTDNSYHFLSGCVLDTLEQRHINPTALVTDSAIRRFGRADGDVNVMVIGGGVDINVNHNARPDRSNLRILSVTGYGDITDRSLVHLATAAPHLRFVDFSGTRVTARGVETFRGLRPDCEVVYTDDND